MQKRIEVAVGILQNEGLSRQYLIAQRPDGSDYAGYWEFPGGKLEAGETPRQALLRELREELGIKVSAADPWIVREADYPHAHVRLHFFHVRGWQGSIQTHYHQAVKWCDLEQIRDYPLLPANVALLGLLQLPRVYAITQAHDLGWAQQLRAIEHALRQGLRLFLLREWAHTPEILRVRDDFYRLAIERIHAAGGLVMIHNDVDRAHRLGADGVHFSSHAYQVRPDLPWVAASCHSPEEMHKAVQIGADFVVLGPVLPTESHPDQPGLGWESFAQHVSGYPLPVFALGGLALKDQAVAEGAGAHGIAMMRAAWKTEGLGSGRSV